MYLTYAEYTEMGGTLDQTSFNSLEFEAEVTINWYTFNRLQKDTQIPVAVKRLIYFLITLANQKQSLLNPTGTSVDNGSQAVASSSNDGVSESYVVLSATDLMNNIKQETQIAVNQYLQGVTNEAGRLLLYRGVYAGE